MAAILDVWIMRPGHVYRVDDHDWVVTVRDAENQPFKWGGTDFTDCISVFRRDAGRSPRKRTTQIRNSRFFEQVQQRCAAEIREVTSMYRNAA